MLVDFRDAAFRAVRQVLEQEHRSIILYNDMGAMELERIKADFPDRTINVGICEQNMATVASGLALENRIVFMYGIISHIFARGFEQIRNDICCPNLPVIMLGVGSGLSYGSDGPTHHGVQDIAVMRTLPNIKVFNPADGISAAALISVAAESRTPCYLRLDKEQCPPLYKNDHNFSKGFDVLYEGNDIALIVTGVLTHRALRVAKELQAEGINVRVIDIYQLKPANALGLTYAINGVNAVVTLEENTPTGGVGSIVGEILARSATANPYFDSISLGDDALMGSCSRVWAESRYGLSSEDIKLKLREVYSSTKNS